MIGRMLGELAGRGRRVPRNGLLILNSKRGPRNFYKGKGVKNTGKSGNKGERLQGEMMDGHVCPAANAVPTPPNLLCLNEMQYRIDFCFNKGLEGVFGALVTQRSSLQVPSMSLQTDCPHLWSLI